MLVEIKDAFSDAAKGAALGIDSHAADGGAGVLLVGIDAEPILAIAHLEIELRLEVADRYKATLPEGQAEKSRSGVNVAAGKEPGEAALRQDVNQYKINKKIK